MFLETLDISYKALEKYENHTKKVTMVKITPEIFSREVDKGVESF